MDSSTQPTNQTGESSSSAGGDSTGLADRSTNKPISPSTPVNVPPNKPVKTGGNKKPILIVGIVLAVLVLLGGSAAAYFLVYLPNKPENVLLQALYNMTSKSELKSAKIDGTLKASGKDMPKQLGDVDVTASLAENGDIAATVSTDFDGTTLSAEVRMIGKSETYLKLNGVKNVDKILTSLNINDDDTQQALALFGPMIAQLDNQWVKADQTSDQITGSSSSALSVLDLSQQDGDKVAEIYQKHPVIEIKEVLADEDVNGESSKHFKVGVNKDNYVAFLTELKDANINKLKVEQSDVDAAKDLDSSKVNLEVWIKKSDKTINQVLISSSEDGVNLELRIAVKDINKEVKVEKPEGAKTFEEIFSGLLGGSGASGSSINPTLSL